MESRARIGGSGTPRFTFTVSTITPEEDLRNTAQSIVYGYYPPRLGKRQQEMLRRMHIHGPGLWGNSWDNRRTLTPLLKRDLVACAGGEVHTKGLQEWKLTDLGAVVGALLQEMWENQ
jgi:hypothetical protein